jgi:hypothetical protein
MYDDDDNDWSDDTEDDGYVPCPYCKEPMYEEAGYCSACDRWISSEDMERKSLPHWQIAVIVVLLAIFVFGALCMI